MSNATRASERHWEAIAGAARARLLRNSRTASTKDTGESAKSGDEFTLNATMLEAAAAAADIGSSAKSNDVVEALSETVVKKKATPSAGKKTATSGSALSFEVDQKKVDEMVKVVSAGVSDPERVARAVAAVVAASAVATLASEPILAAAGAASAVALIKVLELLTGEDKVNSAAIGDALKNLNKAMQPMADKAKDLSQQKPAKEAIERVKSVAVIDQSFDEVFEGLNEKIPTMLNKPKEQPKDSPKPVLPVVEAKVAPPPPAPKPVEVKAPEASKPTEKVVEKVQPPPPAPKPVEKVVPPTPMPVPTPVMASTAAPVEQTKTVEKVMEQPKKSMVTSAWSNDLLNLQYSEQVIEDIRIADANAVEKIRARRLGLDFKPSEAKRMPETEYSFATATATFTSTSSSTSAVDFKAGEVVSALNSSSPVQTNSQRTRSALGISQPQEEPESKFVPASRGEEKKPKWWVIFIAALAAFALFVFIIRAMI